MKERLKKLVFGLLGKDPDAVVVSFASGDAELAARMVEEVRRLEPARRHFVVAEEGGSAWAIYLRLRRRFRGYRVGLAPVLFTDEQRYRPLRRAAFLLAPSKVLAYNARLERHHLQISSAVASVLFLRGVPLDRIWLRPRWLVPWRHDRTVYSKAVEEFEGRPFVSGRKRVAIVSPYVPYPLSHGGAVRIFSLLREIAAEFDVVLLAFRESALDEGARAALLEYCARLLVVEKPRYREPRWSTVLPPEVGEYRSAAMRNALARMRREYAIDAVQVEYTALASYRGDVLVEHDVTFHLYEQIWRRERTASAWWNYWRWRRFEGQGVRQYRRVVTMSEEDRARLQLKTAVVVPNGVDVERFLPEMERGGRRVLFIGSFRHFPNIVAFRFFVDEVWPLLSDVEITVVAGPDALLYWREHTGLLELPAGDHLNVMGFVSDVRPLYIEANLAMVPTLVSAGTNLKVLEALAMERAVISTSSGCAGLGLEHGANVWVADSAEEFADGIMKLLGDHELRQRIATAGRHHAEEHFDWKRIGTKQRGLLREVTGSRVEVRPVSADDLERIVHIQRAARESAEWTRDDYLIYDCHVAVLNAVVVGFLVSRRIDASEREILNVAVDPEVRRSGVASDLIRSEMERWPGTHFLEVRESNERARRLYQKLGFEEVGTRPGYYESPPETAIVMRIHS